MNKLFGLLLLALVPVAPGSADAANCFWVGGTGSINDTSKWASASGGTGGTCAATGGWPNSTADSGTYDASSGGGTITRNVNWTIATLNISAFTGTFGNSGDTATVNLIQWTNSGSGTRTVNMGASTWTCGVAGTSQCNWSQTGATNLTFNRNTSTVVVETPPVGSIQICNFGVFSYNVITFNPMASNGRGANCNTGNTTIDTLNIASPNYIVFNAGANLPIANLNFTGGTPSLSSWTALASATINSAVTFTLTNAASCTYCIFRDMTAANSAITATNAIGLGNNTNISVTPPSGGGGGGGGRIIGG